MMAVLGEMAYTEYHRVVAPANIHGSFHHPDHHIDFVRRFQQHRTRFHHTNHWNLVVESMIQTDWILIHQAYRIETNSHDNG